MTPLRKKRLLLLAKYPDKGHQYFYGQYLELLYEGLVNWNMGTAFLTHKGLNELYKMENNMTEMERDVFDKMPVKEIWYNSELLVDEYYKYWKEQGYEITNDSTPNANDVIDFCACNG